MLEKQLIYTDKRHTEFNSSMLLTKMVDDFVWKDAAALVGEWRWAAYAIMVAYVPMVLLSRALMSRRPAFDLQTPLKIWNCTLSLLSLVGFVINLGHVLDCGFESSYTDVSLFQDGPYGLVLFIFNLSKFLELVDTAFIVLRKKELCFLHWFHHLTVLIYCWITIVFPPPATGYWFGQTNMLVHAVMYGYFAFATTLRGVSWFNPLLVTALQIAQMVWGLLISVLYLLHPSTLYTPHTLLHAAYSIPMYTSYLYLFCSFLGTRYRFQTPINWPMCMYLLLSHGLAVVGAAHCTSWSVVAEVILWYMVSGLGITVGCHRLWTHRSFHARFPTRLLLMLLASIANQGGIYHWSRDHRVHHKECDTDGDPHNIERGFFYSHVGWLMLHKSEDVKKAGRKIDCSDLLQDPVVWIQHRLNPVWDQFWCYVVPGLYGIWRLGSFWEGLLVFGALRWVVTAHATWCVNSVSHTFGYRPYNNKSATNNLFTALIANGEGWHNFHHAYPYDYTTAEHPWWKSINVSTLVIDILWLLGQTSGHKRKTLRSESAK